MSKTSAKRGMNSVLEIIVELGPALLEQSPAIIIILDSQGRIEYVNPKFTEVTGYSEKGVLGKMHYSIGCIPKNRENAAIWKTISSGRNYYGEFCNSKKGGEKYWVDASISPIKNLRGQITHYMLVEEDFTAMKKAEEELVEQKRKVEELSRVKDQFMNTITHDLKTPLSVILGNLSLLRGMAPKEKQAEWGMILDMAERNAIRLQRCIEQILHISRLETVEIKKERISVDELVQHVASEHAPLARMKGVDVRVSARKAMILGDAELLTLALANFLSNAIKFTEKGAVSVNVEPSGQSVIVKVSDTGIGMSREAQEHLFQKYFKVDANAPGSGMGLVLASTIIGKHGGKIRVKSRLGRGSTFEIIFPRGD